MTWLVDKEHAVCAERMMERDGNYFFRPRRVECAPYLSYAGTSMKQRWIESAFYGCSSRAVHTGVHSFPCRSYVMGGRDEKNAAKGKMKISCSDETLV